MSGEKFFTHSERQKASGQRMCLRKNELEGALWKASVAVLDKKKKKDFFKGLKYKALWAFDHWTRLDDFLHDTMKKCSLAGAFLHTRKKVHTENKD